MTLGTRPCHGFDEVRQHGYRPLHGLPNVLGSEGARALGSLLGSLLGQPADRDSTYLVPSSARSNRILFSSLPRAPELGPAPETPDQRLTRPGDGGALAPGRTRPLRQGDRPRAKMT
jgi:hypothetical protein